MDLTYKTNRFKMPLLHVVGSTATNQTFSICFCFMKSERAADYLWALSRMARCFLQGQTPRVVVTDRELAPMSAVRSIFPSTTLLCPWHIQKNILANVKKNFATEQNFQAFMSDWIVLANSIDVESFEREWSRFQATYGSAGQITAYLSMTWIVHKGKFVLAWTKRVLHFGHLVTSRVEGNHSMVKGWIAASTGDLDRVVDRIKPRERSLAGGCVLEC